MFCMRRQNTRLSAAGFSPQNRAVLFPGFTPVKTFRTACTRKTQRYPRDSRIAYFIDPQEQYRVISAAERNGGWVAGFYHSHIDCEAYFSEEDKERAIAWDEPAYPDAVYLVVSVFGDGVQGYKAFSWDEGSRDFIEVAVEVASGR